jgi:hypothetical protein
VLEKLAEATNPAAKALLALAGTLRAECDLFGGFALLTVRSVIGDSMEDG